MKLESKIDSSINYVEEQLVGFIETRYVRRVEDYFIGYISSQTGCNRGCKFCHLTTTKQTKFENETYYGFQRQLFTILKEYEADKKAEYVHWNFMARGEPLCNPTINDLLLYNYGRYSLNFKLKPKFNISTIMPRDFKGELEDLFPLMTPTIYYSMYSADTEFRKYWMPNAMDVDIALAKLKKYQNYSKKLIKFHCAFIKDQNDSEKSVYSMLRKIGEYDIKGLFNIVRYNPYSPEQGEESDDVTEISKLISQYMPCKIITRVGEDIHASCGTFYQS